MTKTVFVVGAGASSEFGLPMGRDLATIIRNQLEHELLNDTVGSGTIIHGSMFMGPPAGTFAPDQRLDWGDAAQEFAAGLVSARSIDRLLHSRWENPLVVTMGKFAIVREIARREAQCWLSSENTNDWNRLQTALNAASETWLGNLFSLRQEGKRPAEADQIFSQTSFITFNYDRIIQRYLHLAFKHILRLPEERAVELVRSINVEHVYGSLGELHPPDETQAPFGLHELLIAKSVGSIRTFTEGVEGGVLDRIRKAIFDAEVLVFLGFSFDPMNLDALFGDQLNHRTKVIATTLGMGENEIRSAQERMNLAHRFNGASMRCVELVRSDMFRQDMLR